MESLSYKTAGLMKRFSSTLMDSVVIIIFSVLFVSILFSLTNFDYYNTELISYYDRYEDDIASILDDDAACESYNVVIKLLCFNIALGILIAYIISEVLIPLLLPNGESIGKRIFGITIMRIDERKIGVGTLLLRGLISKYLIETVPVVFITLYALFFSSYVYLIIIPIAIVVLNVSLVIFRRDHRALHDMIAGTVVLEKDHYSQMVL